MTSYRLQAFILKRWLFENSTTFLATLSRGNLPPIPSVAAIVEQDNHLLMVERSDGLGYCFPGGIIRWKESITSALQREVREETGYIVEVTRLFNNYSDINRDSRISSVCMAYVAKCLDGKLTASKEGVPQWIPLSEARRLKFAYNHGDIIQDFFAHNPFA